MNDTVLDVDFNPVGLLAMYIVGIMLKCSLSPLHIMPAIGPLPQLQPLAAQ